MSPADHAKFTPDTIGKLLKGPGATWPAPWQRYERRSQKFLNARLLASLPQRFSQLPLQIKMPLSAIEESNLAKEIWHKHHPLPQENSDSDVHLLSARPACRLALEVVPGRPATPPVPLRSGAAFLFFAARRRPKCLHHPRQGMCSATAHVRFGPVADIDTANTITHLLMGDEQWSVINSQAPSELKVLATG